ncbi:inositol polyphosphate multikinase isoform X2 [Cephus cinctus]|nr:inositol polyphosphate multikinase isoform X2 [Cephus cinctus]XP_024941505.1 inositol polyphosphate multikinase isoform X2 [Cephus cinctus]
MATLPQLQPGERLRRRGKPSKLKLDLAAARIEHKYPDGIAPLDSQVGGHAFGDKKDTVGMLRAGDGCVLKPVEQPLLGEREIAFYERLQDSRDPLMAELRQYTPSYHGTIELEIFNRRVKFLKLKDITAGMTEPCVMDVKIGKRTWDPLAGPEKKAAEERKYVESKKAYGFCIPGFQIYRLSSSYVKKYGKDFGKKLNKESVVDAMEIFLNGTPGNPPCRDLVLQFLSHLWKILSFFRSQKQLRFYSSSVLLAYDAKRLRHTIRMKTLSNEGRMSPSGIGPMNFDTYLKSPSILRTSSFCSSSCDTGFSGQLTKNGPLFVTKAKNLSPATTPPLSPALVRKNRENALKRSQSLKRSGSLRSTSSSDKQKPGSPRPGTPPLTLRHHDPDRTQYENLDRTSTGGKGLNMVIGKLCRTHSLCNNFDKDIIKIKEEYATLLDELSTTPEEKQNWVRISMIDFTHVFPAESDIVDTNYLEGIENLIKLLETFLA